VKKLTAHHTSMKQDDKMRQRRRKDFNTCSTSAHINQRKCNSAKTNPRGLSTKLPQIAHVLQPCISQPASKALVKSKFHLDRHVTSQHDSTRRAHAFWLCRACRTTRLDKSNVSRHHEPSGIWALALIDRHFQHS